MHFGALPDRQGHFVARLWRPEGARMRSIQRLRLTAGSSFLPLLEKAEVSIWCPDCRSDQIHRSRTRGIIESLLAILLIRPYRCEECD
jgi:hypothetical protein